MKLKIAIIVYAAFAGLFFIVLYLFSLLGIHWEFMWPLILSLIVLNTLITTVMSLNTPDGFASWTPLSENIKSIIAAKIVIAVCLFFVAANMVVAYLTGANYIEAWEGNAWKTKVAVMIFCSLFVFSSSIIGSGFAVGLRNVFPKWLFRLFS